MSTIEQVSVNGVSIYPFGSVGELIDAADERKGILVAINAEKILHATATTRDIINRNIGYCDGAGAMLALRRKGYKNARKIAGCDLWLLLAEHFAGKKTFYLVGAKPQVIGQTVEGLRRQFPGIDIVGFRDGYFDARAEQALIDDIARKRPDVVFVAMGSPRQELLMQRMQQCHPDAIYQGLGGSFDVYTGHVDRAPQWWIDHNLEFAYRLIRQPSRIKRQIHLIKFAGLLALNRL